MTDHDLLRQYARDRSDAAFAELVRRHADWVRASAARQLRDGHMAEDAAQAVFLVLSKKAGTLGERTPLGPWLFGVLRLVARAALRDERRRRRHEQRAAEEAMAEVARSAGSDEALTAEEWSRVAQVLDDSVARLRRGDRDAVLLRFYQRKSFAEVGAALGGVSEEAARKRVDRAVERLRERLAGRGLELALPALAPALWAYMTAAPGASSPPPVGTAAAGRPLQLAKGAMKMARYSALKVPAAFVAAAVVVAGAAVLNRASGPEADSVVAATAPATVPSIGPAAAVQPASGAPQVAAAAEPPQQQKSVLDKVAPSIRTKSPLAGDSVVELVQDMTRTTITVDWEKLGTRGDKGLTLDLEPMPLRDLLNAILKAAGAKKPTRITAEGAKVHVTAAPDDGRGDGKEGGKDAGKE